MFIQVYRTIYCTFLFGFQEASVLETVVREASAGDVKSVRGEAPCVPFFLPWVNAIGRPWITMNTWI